MGHPISLQAYQLRPSIIFFDEIDGLAPVRSTRQDQIHSSIVSTLLALMVRERERGGRGRNCSWAAYTRQDQIHSSIVSTLLALMVRERGEGKRRNCSWAALLH